MRSRELDRGAVDARGRRSTTFRRGSIPGSARQLERRARRPRATTSRIEQLTAERLLDLKALGWSDAAIAEQNGTTEEFLRLARQASGIRPAYRRVDSCAAEVEPSSNYLYSTWGEADDPPRARAGSGSRRAEPGSANA